MKLFALTFSFLLLPLTIFADDASSRTGFVDGPVWFSEESLVENQNVKIYTAIFNGEDQSVSLDIGFFDDGVSLAAKKLTVNPNETKTVSIDWKVSLGAHDMYAEITNAKIGTNTFIPERRETKPISFSVTKDVPVRVAQNAISHKFAEVFSTENLKTEKINEWFKDNFKKSELFREAQLKKFEASKERVRHDKEESKDAKAVTKFLITLHLYLLVAVSFIFSIPVIFYTVTILFCYAALRIVWNILKRMFRRRHAD